MCRIETESSFPDMYIHDAAEDFTRFQNFPFNIIFIDDSSKTKTKTKSSVEDNKSVFDDILQAVESENTKKEDEVNAIFDVLELSEMEAMKTRDEL